VILWSPSSWSVWKECPHKYYLLKTNGMGTPFAEKDPALCRLALPGLFVDRMLQFWLHRAIFVDTKWLTENSEIVWRMVSTELGSRWSNLEEESSIKEESLTGLDTAVRMLRELDLERHTIMVQPGFIEGISPEFGITGAADLLLVPPGKAAATLIDFKNAHRRERMTRDQLVIYQVGLTRKLAITIERAGYLLYNPRIEDWKWFRISHAQEQNYLLKLAEATEEVKAGHFEPRWNHFTCVRFCDVRSGCEVFQELVGRRQFK
jgi:hypothetical protein